MVRMMAGEPRYGVALDQLSSLPDPDEPSKG